MLSVSWANQHLWQPLVLNYQVGGETAVGPDFSVIEEDTSSTEQ